MSRFPGGKKFAFTIFDDTDSSTLENIAPVYRLLAELGMRTTKSVWALANVSGAKYPAATLQDRDYLSWVLQLRENGFEIASHSVRNSDSTTKLVEQGFCEFQRRLGELPRSHANHSRNRENIYWGDARLTGFTRRLGYNVVTRFRNHHEFQGHMPGSEYFWGEFCRQHIDYVRSFVFDEINLDRVSPLMPYHDPARPYVNYWFTSCEGANVPAFCRTLHEANQDRLEEEGGVCIMYTHFANGFRTAHGLEPEFERLVRRLATKGGWFVPVATLLDHLRTQQPQNTISPRAQALLESRWLYHKICHGAS